MSAIIRTSLHNRRAIRRIRPDSRDNELRLLSQGIKLIRMELKDFNA